ncbi:MAG: tRNA dihydrouridine(20/20a) synthase DusA [bacterium]
MLNKKDIAFCVAPMIDWTDRHCRYFHRLLTKKARLYTEMIVDQAILNGDQDYLLSHDDPSGHVALQLGGSEPDLLARAAQIGVRYGYDEVNLNVGCPSDRVQSGAFGAVLMKTPQLVAQCYSALAQAVPVPVTIKCRIGVDDQHPEVSLPQFIETVAEAGCQTFIIHARKAWLQGLSPKENRTIPPLDYELVQSIKQSYPDLTIILNGGITKLSHAKQHLSGFDGVMIGRAAYERPYILSGVDPFIYGDQAGRPTRRQIVEQMQAYIQDKAQEGLRPHAVTRHMIGLYHGQAGARVWRRQLTIAGAKAKAGDDVLGQALAAMPEDETQNEKVL